MAKWLRTFRSRMIGLFALSSLLSGLITFLIVWVARLYYNTVEFGSITHIIRETLRSIGDIYFILFLFIFISFFIFYLLTKPYTNNFNAISRGIYHLSQGDFDHRVSVSTKDEFHSIANDLNRASAKLKEAIEKGEFLESSKDQLIVNLAHDLRTPLTSVLGYIDIILKDETLSKEEKRHYLKIAFNKSKKLEKLLDELFEMTKMNYDMYQLRKTEINLSALLYQLIEEMYPVFEKHSLTLRSEIEANVIIEADGDYIARVFENLLTNAYRYGSDGEFIDIKAFKNDNKVIVQVTNYGSIISEEDLPYIFNMFYTGDESRTTQKDKSGLGLFIAKNIIDQHDGTIKAESNMRHTLFEVQLPSP